MDVELKLLHDNFRNGTWQLPHNATIGSAGIDLLAAIDSPVLLAPNQSLFVSSGISIFINNPNYVLMLFPRSGKGSKGLVLGNLVGIIDADYQGEIKLCMWNRTDRYIQIDSGEYIAQGVLLYKYNMNFNVVEEFSAVTDRGENGFGSTK